MAGLDVSSLPLLPRVISLVPPTWHYGDNLASGSYRLERHASVALSVIAGDMRYALGPLISDGPVVISAVSQPGSRMSKANADLG